VLWNVGSGMFEIPPLLVPMEYRRPRDLGVSLLDSLSACAALLEGPSMSSISRSISSSFLRAAAAQALMAAGALSGSIDTENSLVDDLRAQGSRVFDVHMGTEPVCSLKRSKHISLQRSPKLLL